MPKIKVTIETSVDAEEKPPEEVEDKGRDPGTKIRTVEKNSRKKIRGHGF